MEPDTRDNVKLSHPQIKCVLKQIVEGLVYLHEERGIIHRDIKPHNILWFDYELQKKRHSGDSQVYDGEGLIKITDFNHAKEGSKLMEEGFKAFVSNIGTIWFLAPEFLLEQPYSYGIDIWGLGCIFQYLLTGNGQFIFQFDYRRLNEQNKKRQNLKVILSKIGIPSAEEWPEIQDSAIFKEMTADIADGSKSTLKEYLSENGFESDDLAFDLL